LLYISKATEAIASITGRNLAHAERTKVELAFIGADLHLGRLALVSPTIKQCAALVGTCCPYITAAIAIADNETVCDLVLDGVVPLIGVAGTVGAAETVRSESLSEHFARSTPDEWLEAARAIGPALVWEHMISPLV
jgi:hypothetical protein